MPDLRIVCISSVRPEPTSASQIILHRHLVDQPGIELEIYGGEPARLSVSALIRRLVGRLGRTPLRKWSEDFWAVWQGRWIDQELPRSIDPNGTTIVVTVAHGEGCFAAMRFAKKHHLPLVTFFHDWWPDMAGGHNFTRRRLESSFRRLCAESSVSLCVSEGMRAALCGCENAILLPPIPASSPFSKTSCGQPPESGTFTVLYSGNLTDYGAMIAHALAAIDGHSSIELIVRGGKPNWPSQFEQEMRASGRLLGFAPREEFESWVSSADAFLVPMVFDPGMRRRMETSFPSKLIDFAHFAKPLVIWGPEYCSAVKWARQQDFALCVTDSDPEALACALQQLAGSPAEQQRLSIAARRAADEEFNPEAIQQKFRSVLRSVISR